MILVAGMETSLECCHGDTDAVPCWISRAICQWLDGGERQESGVASLWPWWGEEREREKEREWGGEGGRGGVTKSDEIGESPMTSPKSRFFFRFAAVITLTVTSQNAAQRFNKNFPNNLWRGGGGGEGDGRDRENSGASLCCEIKKHKPEFQAWTCGINGESYYLYQHGIGVWVWVPVFREVPREMNYTVKFHLSDIVANITTWIACLTAVSRISFTTMAAVTSRPILKQALRSSCQRADAFHRIQSEWKRPGRHCCKLNGIPCIEQPCVYSPTATK